MVEMIPRTMVRLFLLIGCAVSLVSMADDAVPLDCNGDNCGSVPLQLPGSEGMPPASEAGSASGHPVDSGEPTPDSKDPLVHVDPPSPTSSIK